MNRLIKYFFDHQRSVHESKWLRRLLCIFVIAKCIYWLLDFKLLFSRQGIVYNNEVTLAAVKQMAFVLNKDFSGNVSLLFIILGMMSSVYLLFGGKLSRLAAFILWYIIVNINNKVYVSLTGADFMLQQVLFFNIFLSNGSSGDKYPEINNALHNFGVLALMVQVCLAYFIAGLAKVLDSDWQEGMAVTQTFQIHDYSLPVFYDVCDRSGFGKLINYGIIVYQMGFSFFIWARRFKKPLILFGILQHLIIAFVMGLLSFGFIMIISYTIFYFPFFVRKHSRNSS